MRRQEVERIEQETRCGICRMGSPRVPGEAGPAGEGAWLPNRIRRDRGGVEESDRSKGSVVVTREEYGGSRIEETGGVCGVG